ncbi:tigger transposable element-derived protein 1-like [Procambarus clarkii]|uniref:tigger transposable element-derived protein 1-like n=1 Tax=Procambarus clarkii TaxID=6728 RepID=UPI00374228A7
MGPKKASGKDQGQKAHVRMTIEEKQEIVWKHENGTSVFELCRQYNKATSTICTILKKKNEIMGAKVAKGVRTITKQRPQILEEVEKLLLIWIHDKELRGDSVSEAIICEKARVLHDDLLKNTPATSDADTKEFKASRGWFEKFRRSGIHSVTRHGEAASSDKPAAGRFIEEFKEFAKAEGYLPQQVFNCDETGLFWKRMPKRTYITKEEKSLPGHKPMKDRFTLVLCSNASGDLKIKPLLVYHSENPRVFKQYKVQKTHLCVMWKANKKAWVTRLIFSEWVNEVVCPAIEKYLQEKHLPLKAMLLLDNAPAHAPGLEDDLLPRYNKFLTVKFLPPNTTPLIQPMNQKIIANFKKLYERALFRKCFEVTEATNLTLKEFWKHHFNICSALKLVDKAWQDVTQRTLISGWRKLWPECVRQLDFEGFEPVNDAPIVEEIVTLGQQMGLELDGDDVEEFVEEHNEELTTEELQALQQEQQDNAADDSTVEEDEAVANVPSAVIKKVCQMWEEIQTIVEKTHPEKAVVGRCLNHFNDNVMPYYRDSLRRRKKQASMDRFVVRKSSSEPQPGPSGTQIKRARESTPERSSLPVIMEADSPSKQ